MGNQPSIKQKIEHITELSNRRHLIHPEMTEKLLIIQTAILDFSINFSEVVRLNYQSLDRIRTSNNLSLEQILITCSRLNQTITDEIDDLLLRSNQRMNDLQTGIVDLSRSIRDNSEQSQDDEESSELDFYDRALSIMSIEEKSISNFSFRTPTG